MREKWGQALEELRRKLRELVEAVDDALQPPPELVPVPIDRGRTIDPGRRGDGRRRRE